MPLHVGYSYSNSRDIVTSSPSFFPPHRQSAPEGLLASYFIAHETLECDVCRNLLNYSFLFTPRVKIEYYKVFPTFESLDEIHGVTIQMTVFFPSLYKMKFEIPEMFTLSTLEVKG